MSGWTEDRIERLKQLHKDGVSFSAIALQLGGVTRNGCISKARRLNLPERQPGSYTGGVRPERAPRPRAERSIKVKSLPAPRSAPFVEGRTVAGDAIGCQFPPGEPHEAKCGKPRLLKQTPQGGERASSYCPSHDALCTMAPKPFTPRFSHKLNGQRRWVPA